VGQARPTVERRELGRVLRRLREGMGRSQQVAADAIGKARTKIISVEDGSGTITAEALEALLDYYEVHGADRRAMLDLGLRARARPKRRLHVDSLPEAYDRFALLEEKATEVSSYDSGAIPGALQSAEYVRATFEECAGVWWEDGSPEAQERLEFRLRRLEKLWNSTEPKQSCYVLTEDALHADMGHREVMRGQLRHLLGLLYQREDLAIRVLPTNAYGNPVRGGGGLLIFGFGDQAAPVGYSGAVLGPSTYYDDPTDVATLRRAFDRIWEISLSERESRRLITELEEA
jgi:transcriptional regulator with XRE-family HTH domain